MAAAAAAAAAGAVHCCSPSIINYRTNEARGGGDQKEIRAAVSKLLH